MHDEGMPTHPADEAGSDPTIPQPEGSEESRQFGSYHLRQEIGQGGMGEVWLAEQNFPIRRKVALKIIKRGMDSKEVVARFEAERQALALMSHPCVAKVHDAGTTPGGRPYFVMEYVPGVPITEYCDRHKLGIRERLALFLRVCEGVQHAHHKAIIHRDLKPSNILVMEQDNKPLPKIIDFGVAKATSQKLTEQTMFTQLGVLIGTPEYMSPEQAELTGEDVDTRTDVYSLGVVLYELLVGALPFEPTELRRAGFDGIRRMIREQEPPRPSTRISTLGEQSSLSADRRGITVPSWRHQLRGDLDWITMKALEKDRVRRYDSPMDLARDLERHMGNQPVEARPPTLRYRAGRFVRRNRAAVAFASVLVALALGSGAALTVLYLRSIQAEREAALEASTAEQALEFMTSLFRASDPFQRGGDPPTARDLLDDGAARLGELDGQPEVQIRLMTTIGDVYRELGSWDEARRILETALQRQIQLEGERSEGAAELRYLLAYNAILSEDYGEAERQLKEEMEIRMELDGEESASVAHSLHLSAFGRVRSGRYQEAEPAERQSMEIMRRLYGEGFPGEGDHWHVLGWALAGQERSAEARKAYEAALRTREAELGYENPGTAWTLNMLGRMLVRQDDEEEIREGIARLEEALALNEKLFDGFHVEIAYNKINIAMGYQALGDHATAERYASEAVEMASNFLQDDGNLGGMKRRLASIHLAQGKRAQAESLMVEHLSALEAFPEAREAKARAEEILAEARSTEVVR